MKKKKIIIIGAGIAGLTSGIYALDNNYDVTIYEKHAIVGGQCTGWIRNNSFGVLFLYCKTEILLLEQKNSAADRKRHPSSPFTGYPGRH